MPTTLGPLVDKLKTLNIGIVKYQDLYNPTVLRRPDVTQVLFNALETMQDEDALRWIVSVLALKPRPYDGTPLAKLWERVDSRIVRGAICQTITYAQPENLQDWLVNTINDPRYQEFRTGLFVALAKMALPDVSRPVLENYVDSHTEWVFQAWVWCGGERELEVLKSRIGSATERERNQAHKAIKAITKRLRMKSE